MNEDVDNLESGLSTTTSNLNTLTTNYNNSMSSINAKNTRQDERLTAVEQTNTSQTTSINGLQTTVGQHSSSISELSSNLANVVQSNTISSTDNSVSVESGGQTMTLTADSDGFLTISFGGLNWKLKLEQETEGN